MIQTGACWDEMGRDNGRLWVRVETRTHGVYATVENDDAGRDLVAAVRMFMDVEDDAYAIETVFGVDEEVTAYDPEQALELVLAARAARRLASCTSYIPRPRR